MSNEQRLPFQALERLPAPVPFAEIEEPWRAAVGALPGKVIVLDDDPTGVQTVHGIPVYTSWEPETLQAVMNDTSRVVYILTNSRAMTVAQTTGLHTRLAADLLKISRATGKPFILISRSDSTLRGHYPLETECLYREHLRAGEGIDGEIIAPFFLEGGRYTFGDIHYVKEGDSLTPAGQTEFAKDGTFGYKASNLREWVEEKTGGKFSAGQVTSITLPELRNRDTDKILAKLLKVRDFNKVILNAVDYNDLRVFAVSLAKALGQGKKFLYRTAAPFVQVIGGICPKPLLTAETLYPQGKPANPGIIVAGSYVGKTTRQLEKLRDAPDLSWIEWDVKQAVDDERLRAEVQRVVREIAAAFATGRNVCLFTSRDYFWSDANWTNSEKNLVFSTRVSDGLVQVVRGLKSQPGFLIAKGGITSSDIGVKGLKVKRALVMGQILPGVPVWQLGPESLFPGLPYVIFPGNVGTDESLREVYNILK